MSYVRTCATISLPMDPTILDADRADMRAMAAGALSLARRKLDAADPDVDPLLWWPVQALLSALFGLVLMLFAIPASSAEPERSFSSASFTLDLSRYRIDLDHFR